MRKRNAFTLVELLVVIGIIALLISILLPALNKARKAAQTVACLANLRTIGQGMQMYVNQYKGSIPGGPATSGAMWYTNNLLNTRIPGYVNTGGVVIDQAPVSIDDYMTPLSQAMGTKLQNIDDTSYSNRFQAMTSTKLFQCPAYTDVLATQFSVVGPGVVPAMSYCTAYLFLITSGTPTPGTTGETRLGVTSNWPLIKAGYYPKINLVGPAAAKIYMADGGKFARSPNPPDYNLTIWPSMTTANGSNGNWADFGPFTTQTNSYERTNAFGNAGGAAVDGRVYAFRHGGPVKTTKYSGMKINAVFYDGHAETLEEMDAANPALWMPKGSGFNAGYANLYPDVVAKYGITVGTWVAP